MITRQHARRIRAEIEKHAETLDDEGALEVPEMFPQWADSTAYAIGDRIRYGGTLYKCLQAHTSQSDWTPDAAVSLWAKVTEPGTIPEWEQPGSTNPYMKGDHVMHHGIEWVSTVDNNVWEPGIYGWEQA